VKILPCIRRGGGPPEGWWRGRPHSAEPSTRLRLVPLPAKSRGGFYSRHMMLCESGVQTPVLTPEWRRAAPVQELQV
jgi:hypothetical protein